MFKKREPLVDSPDLEGSETSIARRRVRVAGRMLGSLLLGGVATLGSILIFRQGLLPLIDAAFHPGPEWLSVFRRVGILLTAVGGYWAFVHWHEKRGVPELRLRPIHLLLGGASGAAMVALPMAVLFAFGVYERVLFRGWSPALLGVAALIGIAAVLEELTYRCLLFRIVERTWGTQWALAVQAVVFALQHLENVETGGISDVVTMLIAVTLAGLLWAAVFTLARNLWVVAAHHAAWNFTILLSGLPLSGIEDWRKMAPLESRFAGPDWLTGGMFGPESSLLVIASTTVVVVLLLRAARRRGAFFVHAVVRPQQPFFMLVGMLFTLLLSACQPIQLPAPKQGAAAVTAPRPDMPSYAERGQFDVGYRSLVSDGEAARSLDVHLWYPALTPAGGVEEIAYEFTLKDPEWQTNAPAIVNGHALRDASVNDAEGPYPLVIFSHGFNTNAAWYSTLLEQYASQGFIVLAPEHVEQDWMESAPATIDRPLDIIQVLDYAEELTGQGGELAGLIDMANVAVVGHSFGGYTTLAMAGAQMDMHSFTQSCAELSPEDPKQFLCTPFLGMDADMAARAGLDAVPADLWPSLGDSRVTAIVSIAGDAFLFGQVGLSKVTIPMMAIGGMADTVTPYDWGSKLSYDYVSSEQKVLVGFQGAEHMFIFTPCAQMPWTAEFPYRDYICFDPVWDKQRGLDLVHHFSTAFLLDTLKGDQVAHEMLLPDAVQFPGIEYAATLR